MFKSLPKQNMCVQPMSTTELSKSNMFSFSVHNLDVSESIETDSII